MWWPRRTKETAPPVRLKPLPRSREIDGIGHVTTFVVPEPKEAFWSKNGNNIWTISQAAFADFAHAPGYDGLKRYFTNPDEIAVVVQLDTTGEILGFNCGEPLNRDYALDGHAAVNPNYQGKGLYNDLRETFDDQLRYLGFTFKKSEVRAIHGAADKYGEIYGDRVKSSKDYYSYRTGETRREFIIEL